MVQYNSLLFFFKHRKSRMICNMTSTIALLRMSKNKNKKAKDTVQSATGK